MEDDALVRDAVARFATWHPSWASDHGLAAHDSRLPDTSPEGHARRVDEARALLRRAEARPDLDAAVVAHAMRVEVSRIEDVESHRRSPDFALELLEHVSGLLLKPAGRSPERVLSAVADRLEAAPRFLREGRRSVAAPRVPPLFAEVALESAAGAAALLDAVSAASARAGLPATERTRLERAAEGARLAVEDHVRWIEGEVLPAARGAIAIGRAALDRVLAARLVEVDAETLWSLGDRLVAEERSRLVEAARTVVASRGVEPGADPAAEALRLVRADHPTDFDVVLASFRDAIDRSRAFVASRGFAPVPEVPLRVAETPRHLRHLVPFAAYLEPGRFSASPEGVYLVTPKVDLSCFPKAEVRTTTVHEAWPGHHLQLSRARDAPLSRVLASATEHVEGWALYCEELMLRHGFLATPEERFVVRRDGLWRALRVRLDVGLATGALGYEEAVRELRDVVGFDAAEAEAETKRSALEPGYNLSYAWGKRRFLDLRARLVEGGTMTERAFHDAVLAAGALPFPLLERALASV